MAGVRTEITELATALGMLGPDLDGQLAAARPAPLRHVDDATWARLGEQRRAGAHGDAFAAAFANGRAFLHAADGLRLRTPRLVEWKGPHRPPGDEVIPADLRVDHVYLVSCKYLSKVLLNSGPPRLFDRLAAGEERSGGHWFDLTAPAEYRALYRAALRHVAATDPAGAATLPDAPGDLTPDHQRVLRAALATRAWPEALRGPWAELVAAVADASACRWQAALGTPRDALRLLWRLLRIGPATYFVLGADRSEHLRLRVDSSWDWVQAFDLVGLAVAPRPAGQPVVTWRADVRHRASGERLPVEGHVEVRWSHGRFGGAPEAKVYLDTPHHLVPGYHALA